MENVISNRMATYERFRAHLGGAQVYSAVRLKSSFVVEKKQENWAMVAVSIRNQQSSHDSKFEVIMWEVALDEFS